MIGARLEFDLHRDVIEVVNRCDSSGRRASSIVKPRARRRVAVVRTVDRSFSRSDSGSSTHGRMLGFRRTARPILQRKR